MSNLNIRQKDKHQTNNTFTTVPLEIIIAVFMDFGEFFTLRTPGSHSKITSMGESAIFVSVTRLWVAYKPITGRLVNDGGKHACVVVVCLHYLVYDGS